MTASAGDTTPQLKEPWKPGQSGNPAGRPKGARNKLAEKFIKAMLDDFEAHGIAAIEEVRTDKPDQYIRTIAAIIPKEIEAGEQLAMFLKESRDAAVAAALRADG